MKLVELNCSGDTIYVNPHAIAYLRPRFGSGERCVIAFLAGNGESGLEVTVALRPSKIAELIEAAS